VRRYAGHMWIAVVTCTVLIIVVGYQLAQWSRRWGPQRRVLRSGEPAEAVVLDRTLLETVFVGGGKRRVRTQHHGSFVLEVRRDGRPPYRALCRQWFDGTWLLFDVNGTYPVRVDRSDPSKVFLDTDAALRRLRQRQEAERARGEERQAQLLRG
jgi:hypothetical protein